MQDPGVNRHRHHFNRREAANRRRPKPLEQPSITLSPGQIVFRLLCHVNTVGGVIGSSGSIVKHLELDTGAKIQVEPPIPGCLERVINVVGYTAEDRRIVLGGENNYAEECEVSQAQEALLRVFERVLDVEGANDGVIGCRLLVGNGQVGPVMGRGGIIVDKIRKSTATKIRVLPVDQLPACALPSYELIQIMGSVVAVKKALLAVSRRLQAHPLIDSTSAGSSSHVPYSVPSSPCHAPSSPPLPSSSIDYSISHSLPADFDRTLSLDEESSKVEISFRLLCSTNVVGGVIGKNATIVRALEKETAASIKMAAPMAGSKERVATVSAMEDPQPVYSPAQIAIVRVFARSIEVGIDHGHISLNDGETVTARLLVDSNQVECLTKDGGRAVSDISASMGVDINILGGDNVPCCADDGDKVIEIIGDYENVKCALFQVTGKLRDDICLFYGTSRFDKGKTGTHEVMDHSVHLQNLRSPPSPRLQSSQMMSIGNATDLIDGVRDVTSGDVFEHGSIKPHIVTNKTVEIVVPKGAFGSIYGEDGSNLARLKQISGANIVVQGPCPGENEGKVIISGTPDQTQTAYCLLQAFNLTVQ
ncbi:hypothetical protein NMG60_11007492 [Bertholletia excelsa]